MKRFPWSGFVYELRRALLSIPLIVLTVLIVLAAFGILATIASSLPAPSNFPEDSSAYFYTPGEYHFEFYAYTQSGSSIAGANFSLSVFPSNATPFAPPASVATASGVTGSSGLVQLVVPLNESNYTVLYNWISPTDPNQAFGPGFFIPVTPPPSGTIALLNSPLSATVQTVHRFLLSNVLLVFYPGPNGTAPPDYQIYWAFSPNASQPPVPLAESSMHRLGSLTSPAQYFSLRVPTPPGTGPSGTFPGISDYLQVELFSTSGRLVAMDTNQSASNFFPPAGGAAGTAEAFGFGSSFMLFLVPLMAILASYSVYGRDRLTGVLEGVLARPVSRLGLVTSRYLAVAVALCLATTIAVASLDGLIAWVYGGLLPLYVALAIFAALLVEVGAFTGITFLLSHALKSAGALVGISLGLFALFTIGWLLIPNIIGGLTGTIFTPGYERTLLELEFLNPVQFMGLTAALYFHMVSVGGSAAVTSPAAYGITLGSVVATGLAWTLGPLALLLYVVRRSD